MYFSEGYKLARNVTAGARSLPLSLRLPSSASHLHQPDIRSEPWCVYIPHVDVQFKYVQYLAREDVRAFIRKWTRGRLATGEQLLPNIQSTSTPAPAPASAQTAPAANTLNSGQHAIAPPPPPTSNQVPGSAPSKCGECRGGEAPMTFSALKHGHYRHVWIRCLASPYVSML